MPYGNPVIKVKDLRIKLAKFSVTLTPAFYSGIQNRGLLFDRFCLSDFNVCNKFVILQHVSDGRCNLDIQPHHVTCLTWPVSRGFLDTQVGIVDSLLVGRIDGSLAVVEMLDRNSFTRLELDKCARLGGNLFKGPHSPKSYYGRLF